MTITVQATYEDGVLKPATPLPFVEHQQVEIEILTLTEVNPPVAEQIPTVSLPTKTSGSASEQQSTFDPKSQSGFGLLGWTGDSETVQRIALDPEFSIEQS